jgi:N-acetylmuramoyl-L-alanine amidase
MVLGYYSALLLVAAGVGAAPSVQSAGSDAPKTMLEHVHRVVIDPGHGGGNNGCLGIDGTYEKTVVLKIAKRVERILLAETNAVPLLTRRTDKFLGLGERSRLANKWKGDIFLSLHLNADAYGSGFGLETWFLGAEAADAEARRLVEQEEAKYRHEEHHAHEGTDMVKRILRDATHRQAQAHSQVLAIDIANGMRETTKRKLRGVKQAPFGVLKAAQMPAIVVEAGFFTHAKEGWTLLATEQQEKIARGIVEGIIAYDKRIGGTNPTLSQK